MCVRSHERGISSLDCCCCSGCRQINNQLCTACHQGSLSSWLFLLLLDSLHLLPKQHQPQPGLTSGCFRENTVASTLTLRLQAFESTVILWYICQEKTFFSLSARITEWAWVKHNHKRAKSNTEPGILIVWRKVGIPLLKVMNDFITFGNVLYGYISLRHQRCTVNINSMLISIITNQIVPSKHLFWVTFCVPKVGCHWKLAALFYCTNRRNGVVLPAQTQGQ